jgi:dTDP-4-dehydrorhamnose 3,5-epimerase
LDVAVDIRKGSPTFGRWVARVLTWRAGEQLFIPAGFAHGFYAMEEDTVVHYKCSDIYRPNDARTIIWNDSDLGIEWPLVKSPILSEADKAAVPLKFAELPEYNQ